MVVGVDAKNGKCFARNIRIGNSPCLDDRANMFALILQFTLQGPCRAMLRHLTQPLAGQLSILPEPVVQCVRGTNDIAKSGAPAIRWKVLGMCVTRPLAFEGKLK